MLKVSSDSPSAHLRTQDKLLKAWSIRQAFLRKERTYKANFSKRRSRFPILQHPTKSCVLGQDPPQDMSQCLYYKEKPHLHTSHYFPLFISKCERSFSVLGHKLLKKYRFRCHLLIVVVWEYQLPSHWRPWAMGNCSLSDDRRKLQILWEAEFG